LPYLTEEDLEEIGIPPDQVKNIFEGLKCLRPHELQNLSEKNEKLFGEYSSVLSENEVNNLYKNNLNQISYLTGVVQHIKRQVRGFDGEEGILETVEDRLDATPAQMIITQVEKNTKLITETLKTL